MSTTTDAEAMHAKLALIARAVEDARAYEHEHGLARHDTRQCPRATLRSLRQWREHFTDAEQRATLSSRAVADAPHSGQRSAGE
jgi:hypothetical protein